MTTNAQTPQLRPFSIIGYSTCDEVLCPPCLSRTTPITGEKVSHVCRRGPRPVADDIRNKVLDLDRRQVNPGKIAKHLRIELATVMRILSGDADDAGTCPACEAAKRTDNREVIPLYFADKTVHDESCTYCGHNLLDLALHQAGERTDGYHVEHTTYGQGHPALQFDRRPPEHVLSALKNAGWRWRPRERVWVDFSRTAEVPSSIRIATKPVPVTITPRPPIIRRRQEVAAAATLH